MHLDFAKVVHLVNAIEADRGDGFRCAWSGRNYRILCWGRMVCHRLPEIWRSLTPPISLALLVQALHENVELRLLVGGQNRSNAGVTFLPDSLFLSIGWH